MGILKAKVQAFVCVALAGLCSVSTLAQATSGREMTKSQQEALANKVIAELKEKYPFPDVTQKMEAALRRNLAAGVYEKNARNPELFAARITNDLQEISRDRHVSLKYSPETLKVEPLHINSVYTPAEGLKQMEQEMRESNYGTSEIRILDGNVGYVRFDVLAPLQFAGDTYAAAMRYVANTDALIIDLRNCGGGRDIDAVPFLAGYLFEHPVHLSDFYLGAAKTPRQLWSAARVPGPTYYDKPVFMLTSRGTFSGCEAFAYELQAHKRVKVVGEVTGGGANPNAVYPIDEHFALSTPFARGINPVTGTNWQEKGVQPDVPASRVEALFTAQRVALEALMEKAPQDRKQLYADKLDELKTNAPRIARVTFKLPAHLNAKSVAVLGSFNGFVPWANPMKNTSDGWIAEIPLEPGNHTYVFLVDGEIVLDPNNAKLNRDKKANVLKVD